jgi:hypothetical protein
LVFLPLLDPEQQLFAEAGGRPFVDGDVRPDFLQSRRSTLIGHAMILYRPLQKEFSVSRADGANWPSGGNSMGRRGVVADHGPVRR